MNPLVAFDADVVIYAGQVGHPLGRRILRLFPDAPDGIAGVGSLILLSEVLAKPMRLDPSSPDSRRLLELVGRLDLHPVDDSTAQLALALAIEYKLRAADSVHLATAIAAGADRFLTNNRKDFPKSIREIDIVYPDDLPDPGDDPADPGDESGE